MKWGLNQKKNLTIIFPYHLPRQKIETLPPFSKSTIFNLHSFKNHQHKFLSPIHPQYYVSALYSNKQKTTYIFGSFFIVNLINYIFYLPRYRQKTEKVYFFPRLRLERNRFWRLLVCSMGSRNKHEYRNSDLYRLMFYFIFF